MQLVNNITLLWAIVFVAVNTAAPIASADPIGYSVQAKGDDHLYRIDLATGVATKIGPVGFTQVRGLAYDPSVGILFGADDKDPDQLIQIDLTTGAGTVVGPFGINADRPGLAIDPSGNLFLSREDASPSALYSINRNTGQATLIGSTGVENITGIAFLGSVLYGVSDNTDALYTIDTLTGMATVVGVGLNVNPPLNIPETLGLAADATTGLLYILDEDGNSIQVDPATGAGILLANTLTGFQALVIPRHVTPEPTSIAVFAVGLLPAVFYARRSRRKQLARAKRKSA